MQFKHLIQKSGQSIKTYNFIFRVQLNKFNSKHICIQISQVNI
jgi:hypothetical protein